MAEMVLMSIPSVVYLAVQGQRARLGRRVAARRVGLTWGTKTSYLWGLVLLIPLGSLAWLTMDLIPEEVLNSPSVAVGIVTVSGAITVLLRAMAEEILFRGLLGGVLFRRLGFARGNLLQALIFVLPHLFLLTVDLRTWPVLPMQFLAGWLLGWLRYTSDSFLPGGLVHGATNLIAGMLAGS